MQITQAAPPQQTDANRVVTLRDKPVAQRAAGDVNMPGNLHNSLDAAPTGRSPNPCYTEAEAPSGARKP